MSVGIQNLQSLGIRSGESIDKVFVNFINTTQRIVEVIWINYDGNPVRYMTLEPGKNKMMYTYKSHPWIFRDKFTGERMHVGNNDVYWPMPLNIATPESRNIIVRRDIHIHFPLRTLTDNSLWTVIKLLKDAKSIDDLHIPFILKNQLKNISSIYFAER